MKVVKRQPLMYERKEGEVTYLIVRISSAVIVFWWKEGMKRQGSVLRRTREAALRAAREEATQVKV